MANAKGFPGRLPPFPPGKNAVTWREDTAPRPGDYPGAMKSVELATITQPGVERSGYPGSGMPGEPFERAAAPEPRRLRRDR
jgi:hypothetical protein